MCLALGNAVCCAVASATIDVIKEENLLENTKQRGEGCALSFFVERYQKL
jgi:4-aminobutyrate aminotransferase-like enzyme